ncbi:hypothetical protein HAX54_004901 [Datura stramonium]|uniref:Uncharacterized protein n=1 Tax=Datura stramonium TaxID=4076 RepID=A0ABS8WX92_DATST|nr:hypothetical protein [Datura stramonium]
MEDVTSRYISDGAFDGRQSDDGPPLLPSKLVLCSLRVMEMAIDHQTNDGPSWPSSPRPRFSGLPLKGSRGEYSEKKNRSFRPGVGVTEDVMSHHTSDGAFDRCQSDDEPSLLSSRPGLCSLKVTEMAIDLQTSVVPAWPSSPRPRFSVLLLKG